MSHDDILRFNGYMARAGYNISSLADTLGMTRPTLSSRIHGRTDFSRGEMERIAAIFHATPQEVFFGDEVS